MKSHSPADYVKRFISNLTHTKGQWAGQPFNILPWQNDIIDNGGEE